MTEMSTDAFNLILDRQTNSAGTLDIKFMARQVADFPHVASINVRPAVVPTEILPAGCELTGSFQTSGFVQIVAESSDCSVRVESYGHFSNISVASTSHQRALEVLESMQKAAREGTKDAAVEVIVWHGGNGGGDRSTRPMSGHRWPDIVDNYPLKVRSQLGQLMSCAAPETGDGRLILFHGEPGTGKTTAIQALMDAWSSWCEPNLIADPDRLFAESEYLMKVLESQSGVFAPGIDRPAKDPMWKLVVAEDADAFLRSTGHSDAGAALGRLLNTTDGMLGQTTRSIVLLTTNEELPRLHPALMRPGRSHSKIEFTRFNSEEATEWLGGEQATPRRGATLAELFEVRRTGQCPTEREVRTGSYL